MTKHIATLLVLACVALPSAAQRWQRISVSSTSSASAEHADWVSIDYPYGSMYCYWDLTAIDVGAWSAEMELCLAALGATADTASCENTGDTTNAQNWFHISSSQSGVASGWATVGNINSVMNANSLDDQDIFTPMFPVFRVESLPVGGATVSATIDCWYIGHSSF